MLKYWVKIGLGALVIFVVGYGVVQAARGARHVASGANISIGTSFIPFTVGGTQLGTVRRVTLRRERSRIMGVDLQVELKDAAAGEFLSSCQLTVDDPDRIGDKSIFHCAAGDSGAPRYEQFGEVRVTVDGVSGVSTIPLLVPAEVVREFRSGDGKRKGAESASTGDAARAEAEALRQEAKALAESLKAVAPPPPKPPKP